MLVGKFCGLTGIGLSAAAVQALAFAQGLKAANKMALALAIADDRLVEVGTGQRTTAVDPGGSTRWLLARPLVDGDGIELLQMKFHIDRGDPRPWLAVERRWEVSTEQPPVDQGQLAIQLHSRNQYLRNERRDPSKDAVQAYREAEAAGDHAALRELRPIVNRDLLVRCIGGRVQICVGVLADGEPAVMYEVLVEQLVGPKPAIQLLAECEFAQGRPVTGGIGELMQVAGNLRRPPDAEEIPGLPTECWQWRLNGRQNHGDVLLWVGEGRDNNGEWVTRARLKGQGNIVCAHSQRDAEYQVFDCPTALSWLNQLGDVVDLSEGVETELPYLETYYSFDTDVAESLSCAAEFEPYRAWPDVRQAMSGAFNTIDGRPLHLAPIVGVAGTVESVDEVGARLVVSSLGVTRAVDFPAGTLFSVTPGQRIGWADSVGVWPSLPKSFDDIHQLADAHVWQDIYRRFLLLSGLHDRYFKCVHLPVTYVQGALDLARRGDKTGVPFCRLAMTNVDGVFETAADGLFVARRPLPVRDATWLGHVYLEVEPQLALLESQQRRQPAARREQVAVR